MADTTLPPKVFVSYSHDSQEHKEWVLSLSKKLMDDGIDVILDQWDIGLSSNEIKFMNRGITESSRVLIICTEIYVDKANAGKGGVGYEGTIINEEFYEKLETNKFIPIIRQNTDRYLIPAFLKGQIYANFSDNADFDKEYEKLIRELHNEPVLKKPPVGEKPFLNTGVKPIIETQPQIITNNNHEFISVTPNWATFSGQDQYGSYADFTYISVTQRMRWIKPGTFMMGSPENEPEKYDDERQHRVTLTRGYWLAETAVTQELWEAVMKENPSTFRGKNRPVETVSWKDSVRFIQTINDLNPGLDLRLPTEAEWEYACRAGTETPFSFGRNITTDQVNYDGNYPYAKGKKGKYREETVDVKSLPANPWGLYEIHGNVREWCSDWYGGYPERAEIDPRGPENDVLRVMRGGSWSGLGRNVRSANRRRDVPGNRRSNTGFRLARGQ